MIILITKTKRHRVAEAVLVLFIMVGMVSCAGADNNSPETIPVPTQNEPVAVVTSKITETVPTQTLSAEAQQIKDQFSVQVIETLNQISLQEEVDKNLKLEMESGLYNIEAPLVVVNPYELSPLSAIVLFKTAEPVNISVHVPGKDSITDIDFTFSGYGTEHIVPVYGLYAGIVNKVVMAIRTQSGKISEMSVDIETEPLVKALEDIEILTDLPQPEKYQDGLNFMYGSNNMKAAFDHFGDVRWYLKGNYLLVNNYDYNGHMLMAKGSALFGDVLFLETTRLGKILKVLYAPYGCHHDIEKYSNNSLLVTGSEGETVEDLIYEINTQTGEIVNTLDLKTVFPQSRKGLEATGNSDWLHLNDVSWVGSHDIIISARNQSIVARISWPEGTIDWILAPHEDWPAKFDKYLLEPTGSTFEWQYNQHTPVVLPDYDSNPDTIDLLLFDNGNQRFGLEAENNEKPYTRIVHFRVNEMDMTVEQIWQYGNENDTQLYSPVRGNANLLGNGNIVAFFCVPSDKGYTSQYIELDEDSKIVWQAQASAKQENGELLEYRVERMPIYNDSANDSVIGSRVLNLIPEEILTQYETH